MHRLSTFFFNCSCSDIVSIHMVESIFHHLTVVECENGTYDVETFDWKVDKKLRKKFPFSPMRRCVSTEIFPLDLHKLIFQQHHDYEELGKVDWK